MYNRNSEGRFINKSFDKRQVRTIRTTDEIWQKFGEMAVQRSITRADLLEEIVKNSDIAFNNDRAVDILQEALKLKANAGGAIKRKIREVLLILDR